MTEALLLFLGREGGFDGWLRLSGGEVVERGTGSGGLPAVEKSARLIAVAPGEQVTLRWLDLPGGLAPAQAQAAARLMAAELSAEPIADMHVAVAREEGSDRRAVALVPNAAMAEWLDRLRAQGLEADHIVPETLLLSAPAEGVARVERGATSLYRGPGQAFALEPQLAAMLLGEQPVTELDSGGFEAGLSASLSPPLLDLRQGPFGRRRQWRLERARVRRLALLLLAILAVTLIVQIATLLRYTFAADALEAEAKRVATAALPQASGTEDLGRRVAALRGGGAGYGATASAVFAAVRATPNVELSALSFASDGSLRATVQGDAPASLSALETRIEGSGFTVEVSPLRSGGGRQIADLLVRAR